MTRARDGWRARLPHAYGRRSLGVYATEAEARAVLVEALRELAADPAPLGETLDEWADRALAAREGGDHKRRTCERDRTRWGTLVRGTLLGRTPLLDVDEHDVRRWLDGLRRQDGGRLAPTTARNALTLVRVVLEAAREAGRIRANPAADVRLSRPARRRAQASEWTWLRAEEIVAVLGCEEIPVRSRAAYAVAIYAGLRAGELWGLRWEDVDTEHGVLHVRHSFEAAPKSHQVRDVPLLRPAREWLARWRAESERDGVRSRHGLVWPARDEAWHRDGYDAGWAARWRAAAGIERRARLHDLRHTCASHLLQGTWAPTMIARALRIEEVRDWLGHHDITTTQRYAHLCADGVRALVRQEGDGDEARAGETRKAGRGDSQEGVGRGGHLRRGAVQEVLQDGRKGDVAARGRGRHRDHPPGHGRDTPESHLRELNSGPTVYETAPGPSTAGPIMHGSAAVSSDVSRLRDLAVRTLRAIAAGDPMRDRLSAETAAAALDVCDTIDARHERAGGE